MHCKGPRVQQSHLGATKRLTVRARLCGSGRGTRQSPDAPFDRHRGAKVTVQYHISNTPKKGCFPPHTSMQIGHDDAGTELTPHNPFPQLTRSRREVLSPQRAQLWLVWREAGGCGDASAPRSALHHGFYLHPLQGCAPFNTLSVK